MQRIHMFAEHQHRKVAKLMVRMHHDLHRAVKIAADDAGQSMNEWAVRALAAHLQAQYPEHVKHENDL